METLNHKILSFSARLFTQALTTLIMVFAVSACGNKSSANDYPPGVGIMGGCISNCQAMQSPQAVGVFNAKNGNGQANFANMQLIVNGVGFVPGASSVYNLYSGPVAFQGVFVAANTLMDPVGGGCVIPAGSYPVQTSSIGAMSMGSISTLEMISTVGNIRFRLNEGMLYKDGLSQATRMFGSVSIVSVNGFPCSTAFNDTFN